MAWRAEDEVLLQRLEDETLALELFRLLVGSPAATLHPRAGGLVGELRCLPGGAAVVAAALDERGELAALAAFVEALRLKGSPPELLHHLALFHGKAAAALEHSAPHRAATAWVRSLAGWLALAEERTYLARLESAVLGDAARPSRMGAAANPGKVPSGASIPPERVPLELISELGQRAEATSRDLAAPGTAALMALARTEEAARLAEAAPETTQRARLEAQRRRNGAIESALTVIADAVDEANVQGELVTAGRTLILRAIAVWSWTGNDEAVEHFVVGHLDKIGWEIYRARDWASLRYLLDPFRPMMERLAARIEMDPSEIAYAAGCAQIFVFLAESERDAAQKLALAERSLVICPSHRNGRVVLASILCDRATDALREMSLLTSAAEIERAEAQLVRAEALFPTTRDLPEAKTMLERAKKRSLIAR